MMRNYCASTYIYFLLIVCFIFVFAPPGFSAGKITIEPFIELKTRIDSNFFSRETNPQSVNTYIINPGIALKYSIGKSMIGLDYDTKLKWEDGDNDDDHNLALLFRTQAADMLEFSVDNTLMKTQDPLDVDENANATDRYRYYVNTFSPQLNYQLSEDFKLRLKYINKITDYIDDAVGEGENSQRNEVGSTLFYQMNSKTTLDLAYQHWQMDYSGTSAEYTSDQIMSNVNYKFHELALTAGAGYHSRKFDEYIASGDLERFVWKMELSGQGTKSSFNVSLKQNYNDSGETFTTSDLNVQFTYSVTDNIKGKLNGSFKNADYENSIREDDRWSITPAVEYLVDDNFTIALETGYEERDSNTAGNNFDNEYGMIKIKYAYDAWSR
jgi:polysaccharide biosynthesis protein VpsM